MKKVTTDLETYLNTEKSFTSCDLYELALSNGNKCRYRPGHYIWRKNV